MSSRYTPWPKEQEALLCELYKSHSRCEIAAMLGRTEWAVKSKLDQLGVKNSPEEIEAKYKKDNAKRSITAFKKGNVPHNTLHHRKISIRRYGDGSSVYYLKLSLSNWVPLHVAVWIKANKELPNKHVLRFKDGNSLNPSLENLECIPMSLNMLLNSKNIYHPEVAKTYDLINTLKKAIHEHK
jgi:hypothetical protein